MKIVVLSGSPKGSLSTTLQYVFYLQKMFPEHEFHVLAVVKDRGKIAGDEAAFRRIIEYIRGADGVLWAFPIYTFLVHAYYKEFIERVLASDAREAFAGKYTATLSTSIHFFDHTSHNYVHGICDDLGMHFVEAYSPQVYDLLKPAGKRQLVLFAKNFFAAIAQQRPIARCYEPVRHTPLVYAPGPAGEQIDMAGKRMVILTDDRDPGGNLARMIERFRNTFTEPPEVINLNALSIRHGCDGCFRCGADGVCVYHENDDVHALYLSKLAPADVIVMAGTVEDRYLSSRWKIFYDRGFFRPVIPWWPGKQLAFLVSGPLRQLPNLREILTAYTEFHQGNLVGIVTDEEDSATLDGLLDSLAGQLVASAKEGRAAPWSFLGVGGTRIFRDDTFGFLRPVFQVAHRYYKRHGLYDFPHHSLRTRGLAIGGMLLTSIPGVKKKFFEGIKAHSVKCLQNEVKKAKPETPNQS